MELLFVYSLPRYLLIRIFLVTFFPFILVITLLGPFFWINVKRYLRGYHLAISFQPDPFSFEELFNSNRRVGGQNLATVQRL